MESDDSDFETGLPAIPKNDGPTANLNLQNILEGRTEYVSFEDVQMVATHGYQKQGMVNTLALDRETLRQMTMPILVDGAAEEEMKVMFGDFSGVEKLMENATPDGKIKKKVMRPGTGRKVEPNQIAVVHYMIGAETMDDLIESTYASRRPRRMRVGCGEVLPVLDFALVGMRIGEMAKFLATSEYAFGRRGVPLLEGTVPPDVRVMLQVEVLETYVLEKNNVVAHMSEAERRVAPFEELHKFSIEVKQEGNREFKERDYHAAVKCYLEVLSIIGDMSPSTDEQRRQYFEIRLQACNNVSQSYYNLEKYHKALRYAEDGTKIPLPRMTIAKSHYWCAKSLLKLGKYEDSLLHVQTAHTTCADKATKMLMHQVETEIRKRHDREKELCSRMVKTLSLSKTEAKKET